MKGCGNASAALPQLPKQGDSETDYRRDKGHCPTGVARNVADLFLRAVPRIYGGKQGPGEIPAEPK